MGCAASATTPQDRMAVLQRENLQLRQQVQALMDVQVPAYFSGQTGKLDPFALKVLSFWFGMNYDGHTITPEAYHLWFGKSDDVDLEISLQFEPYLANTAAGLYDHWAEEPLGVIALLILMDQCPRNIYRNSARAFSYDWKAVVVAQDALKKGVDDRLTDLEKVWIYLVLTHTEDLTSQKLCVQLAEDKLRQMDEGFRKMWNMIFYKHLVVIEKFGRFPHRNEFLRRPSTPEEEAFVKDPTYRFDLPVQLVVDPETGEAKFIFLTPGAAAATRKSVQGNQGNKHSMTNDVEDRTDILQAIPELNQKQVQAIRQSMRTSVAPNSRVTAVGSCVPADIMGSWALPARSGGDAEKDMAQC